MSANNQHQQAEASVAAPAASSEYLKRTCLICGCHTNQTINIYEPRSGPNIVQLIQAKFKFQPLNEDKFLCFSCNNWLINWHSLQTVNSNEAESQSQSPSHMGNSSSVLQQERTKLRPVAMVRPQVRVQPQSQPQPQPQVPATPAAVPITYAKRRSSSSRRSSSASVSRMSRILRQCCLESLRRSPKKRSSQQQVFVYLRSNQRRSNVLCKVVQCVAPRRKPLETRVVKETAAAAVAVAPPSPSPYQRFPQPSVDGKVVAMFRRLGTTLSREEPSEDSQKSSPRPPQIMSPAKQRPRWSRTLEEDEILLEFDSAITEVLPPTTSARRCLSYQVADGEMQEDRQEEEHEEEEPEQEGSEALEVDMEQEVEVVQEQEAPLEPQRNCSSSTSNPTTITTTTTTTNSHQVSHQALAGLRLPQGLSISLV
ncbi:hypothetical protein KR018_004980 [Drosophila ironensis]|nr:hypothetical protein KR018_004980 [Drosophila ironensis]